MPQHPRSHEVPMSRRALVLTLTLAGGVAVAACSETVGLAFGDTGVLAGGINQGGNGQFGKIISSQYFFLYPATEPACTAGQRCGLAESRSDPVGSLTNGGTPFMLVSTENPPVGGAVTIQTSGIRTGSLTIDNPAQYRALRLVLEWAFLTSRFTPATANDSAIVRIKSGNDSAVVFRVTSADLQSGRITQRAGGCGPFTLFNRAITYGACTDWQTAPPIDLTAWKDRTFELHFIVGEAAPVVTGLQDAPSVFLFRRATIEGGQ
jgi:hypothetical protein